MLFKKRDSVAMITACNAAGTLNFINELMKPNYFYHMIENVAKIRVYSIDDNNIIIFQTVVD